MAERDYTERQALARGGHSSQGANAEPELRERQLLRRAIARRAAPIMRKEKPDDRPREELTSDAKPGVDDQEGLGERAVDASQQRADALGEALDPHTNTPAKNSGASTIAESNKWNKNYQGRRTNTGVKYEDYKQSLSPIKASSDSGGRAIKSALTLSELYEIFPTLAEEALKWDDVAAMAKRFVDYLNQAWRLMKIDTIEAQAAYLANAAVESKEFKLMTEGQPEDTYYTDDPSNVKNSNAVIAQGMTGRFGKTSANADAYRRMQGVDRDGGDTFLGRGPAQITSREVYVECIAVLEHEADVLSSQPERAADVAKLRTCAAEVKALPRNAAKPENAMLMSAALMKVERKGKAGDEMANQGNLTGFMGRQTDKLPEKTAAKARILKLLEAKLAKEKEDAVGAQLA